jgi:hypothetical protein
MKRKILTSLLLMTILMLAVPAGIVVAKAAPQDIAFDLSGSWEEEGIDPDTGEPVATDYGAAVILTGKISDKGDGQYLSPLHGTIALDGSEYTIQVKQIKQSEPLYGQEGVTQMPNGWTLVTAQTFAVVEANVEGGKLMGWLEWGSNTLYDAAGNVIFSTGGTDVALTGIMDGKLVSVSLAGDNPEIE